MPLPIIYILLFLKSVFFIDGIHYTQTRNSLLFLFPRTDRHTAKAVTDDADEIESDFGVLSHCAMQFSPPPFVSTPLSILNGLRLNCVLQWLLP